jgi:hypothetical protein
MTTYPKLGTVSHGTLRPEDLIPTFLDTLREVSRQSGDIDQMCRAHELVGEIEARTNYDSYFEEDHEDVAFDLERLTDYLNGYAPPYCYFGSHPGDGSDFGFWLDEDWQARAEEDGVPVISCWEEMPGGNYSGNVFLISDHGNVTLYFLNGRGAASEIFGIV